MLLVFFLLLMNSQNAVANRIRHKGNIDHRPKNWCHCLYLLANDLYGDQPKGPSCAERKYTSLDYIIRLKNITCRVWWRRQLCRFIVHFVHFQAVFRECVKNKKRSSNSQLSIVLCIWFRMMITIVALSMRCYMPISVKFTICRKKREIWFCRSRIVIRSFVSNREWIIVQWVSVACSQPVEPVEWLHRVTIEISIFRRSTVQCTLYSVHTLCTSVNAFYMRIASMHDKDNVVVVVDNDGLNDDDNWSFGWLLLLVCLAACQPIFVSLHFI